MVSGKRDKCKYVREKNLEPFRLKYSLRQEERLALMREVGVNGLVLFEYYLRMASTEDTALTDEGAAAYFGWNRYTAERWRRALVKNGWVYIDKVGRTGGRPFFLYYLGKAEVEQAKKSKGP